MWLFLHLPLKVRLKIAEKIRAKSRQDKQYKIDFDRDFTVVPWLEKQAQLPLKNEEVIVDSNIEGTIHEEIEVFRTKNKGLPASAFFPCLRPAFPCLLLPRHRRGSPGRDASGYGSRDPRRQKCGLHIALFIESVFSHVGLMRGCRA